MIDSRAPSTPPWSIDIRAEGLDHRSGAGLTSELDRTGPAPAHITAATLTVVEDSDVRVTGRLESVAEGVLVSATVTATATGQCGRCLREITDEVSAQVRELFAYPDSSTARTSDPDEIARIVDDRLDLGELIHDELVLALPTLPLCRPDCPGLCPDCGEHLDTVGPDHRHETIDPRWAALVGLLRDDDAGRTGPAGPGGPAGDYEEK